MTIDATKFSIPKVLTPNEWKKHKSVVAKIVKKPTDVGAALDDLETAQDAVMKKLANPAFPADAAITYQTTLKDWTAAAVAKGKDFMVLVNALSHAAETVKDRAEAAAVMFKDSKIVPKSTTAYAESVMKAAVDYRKSVDSVSASTVINVIENAKPGIQADILQAQQLMLKVPWDALKNGCATIAKAKLTTFTEAGEDDNLLKLWYDNVQNPVRAVMAAGPKLSPVDPKVAAFYTKYSKPLRDGSDAIAWTSVSNQPKVYTKIFELAQQMAADGKKIATEFG